MSPGGISDKDEGVGINRTCETQYLGTHNWPQELREAGALAAVFTAVHKRQEEHLSRPFPKPSGSLQSAFISPGTFSEPGVLWGPSPIPCLSSPSL